MREEEWFLVTEDESGVRRVPVCGHRREGEVLRFTAEGAAYTVYGGARVVCEGELSYELTFDVRRVTSARIVTPYGELPATVRTHSAFFTENGFGAEYTLCLAGQPSWRKIAFLPASCVRGTDKIPAAGRGAPAADDKEGV